MSTQQNRQGFNWLILLLLWLMTSAAADVISVPSVLNGRDQMMTLAPEADISGSLLWDVITYPCLRYLLLVPKYSHNTSGWRHCIIARQSKGTITSLLLQKGHIFSTKQKSKSSPNRCPQKLARSLDFIWFHGKVHCLEDLVQYLK